MGEVWIVGQINPDNYKEWEFQGVFSTEDKAIEACRTENYFIAPIDLDKIIPHESLDWEGAYYPLAG